MSAREKKALYFKNLHQILEDYTKVFVVEIKHVSSKQVADIRKALRGQALLLFGKKTMVRCCMRKFVEEHPGHPIEKLIDMVHGNIGLVFVNGDMSAVRETILNNNWDKFGGKVETLGLVSGDDPEQNYVQIPMTSTQWADGKFTQACP